MLQKIQDGRTDLVFDYLRAGHPATATDEHGVSLIKHCAYYGDVSAVKYLVQQGAKLSELGRNYNLNGAAFHGHWQLCQYLIEQGADVNAALEGSGETPLHASISAANRASSPVIVKLLLANGAKPNVATVPGQETGSFMRDVRTRGETPLHRAAAFASAETITLLLEAGADKSRQDTNGDSPISWASWHLRPGSILALLAYGEHRIHPLHVERMQSDHGFGGASGMQMNLLGNLHL
ncbi:MAG: ankyrin repeat domain-containing protein [Saprospiraceae bacterium]|nr:ankyrin repeat domain-containing protein [Saprospiraceae bacterium]